MKPMEMEKCERGYGGWRERESEREANRVRVDVWERERKTTAMCVARSREVRHHGKHRLCGSDSKSALSQRNWENREELVHGTPEPTQLCITTTMSTGPARHHRRVIYYYSLQKLLIDNVTPPALSSRFDADHFHCLWKLKNTSPKSFT